MRFEDNARPRRRHRGPVRLLFSLLLKLLILIAVCAVILYLIPVGAFMIDKGDGLSPDSALGTSRINILLLGVDKLNYDSQRSDTMIVLSVGYGKCAVTSILRDTVVNIPGHGWQKINAAYAHGGAELAVRTVNENFGLNITKYVVVDFVTLAELINAVGGVDILITESEQTQINKNVVNSWSVFRAAGYDRDATAKLSLDFSNADAEGCVLAHLDGIQALGYARIRKTDSDFTRASRQRRLITAAVESFKTRAWNPVVYYKLIKTLASSLDTNMNFIEISSIGLKGLFVGDIGQFRLPISGTFSDDGSSLSDVNFEKNRAAFIEFVYD